MGLPVPKPDLRGLVAAIREQTELARQRLEAVIGPIDELAERELRAAIARAVDYGVEAQRDAFLSAPELLPTPIRPPPSDVPLPKPPKLPRGVR